MFNKNVSLGVSLQLTLEDYKKIFEQYHKNIKEIYFSTTLTIPEIHSRSLIAEENEDKENEKKLIEIIKLAETYNIKTELAINSRFDLTEDMIKQMYEWCKKYKITINKIVTLNNLINICYKYFGNVEYCYSYNNNIVDDNFLDHTSKLFTEIVIGNRQIRNINLMKKIKEKGLEIKLLVDNGCQHNCRFCSTLMAGYCDYIFEKNLEKYSIDFLIAIQTIFPYEIKQYYDKLGLIDNYKLSTRVCTPSQFKDTMDYYLHSKEITNKNEMLCTSKLGNLYSYIEEHDINLYKIYKIKEKIWEDIFGGKNIMRNDKE